MKRKPLPISAPVRWGALASLSVLAMFVAAAAPATAHPTMAVRSRRTPHPPFAVGKVVFTFVDRSQHVTYPGHRPQPRPLQTVIRYPAAGNPSRMDIRRAPPMAAGPFPLVVFGHGFDVTPATYTRLLRAWARAGYVVAAPVFPLTNAHAPGGANESDLVNQPRDMSFVISRMISISKSSGALLSGVIDPRRVAVTGQSDGGSTALAAAYNTHFLDPRIGAAMILSGAEIPGVSGYDFPAGTPPLLATQGTADNECPSLHLPLLPPCAAAEVPAIAAGVLAPTSVHDRATTARRRRARDDRVPGSLPQAPSRSTLADVEGRQRARRRAAEHPALT